MGGRGRKEEGAIEVGLKDLQARLVVLAWDSPPRKKTETEKEKKREVRGCKIKQHAKQRKEANQKGSCSILSLGAPA